MIRSMVLSVVTLFFRVLESLSGYADENNINRYIILGLVCSRVPVLDLNLEPKWLLICICRARTRVFAT